MLGRLAILWLMSVRGLLRRLHYDLARELVIFSTSAILFALFYYVFNDFLNEEVARISLTLRQQFGEMLGTALLLAMAVACGRSLRRQQHAPFTLGRTIARLGEATRTVTAYRWLTTANTLLLYLGPTFGLIQIRFAHWQATTALGWGMASVALSLAIGRYPQSPAKPVKSTGVAYSPGPSLLGWRLRQMLTRNRLAQACLIAASLYALAPFGFQRLSEPVFIAFAFLAGLHAAFALAFQTAFDLSHAWFEKNLGVSHSQYMRMLWQLSSLVGLAVASLVVGVQGLWQGYFAAWPAGWLLTKAFWVAWTPAFLVPNLVFQIDARRGFIQVLSLILVALFVCTAIYASLISLLLLPVIAHYGHTSQQDRYYRA